MIGFLLSGLIKWYVYFVRECATRQAVSVRDGYVGLRELFEAVAHLMISREFYGMSYDEVALPNKSPEPTAVGACSSAVAVHVASRRWLSFFR